MPKRKRDEDEEKIDRIENRAIRIKALRLRAKIDQGNKSLKSALQLARGFERQKLGRRQKQASDEPHTLLRLREEVIILKELDVGKTAHQYLFKQLVKTRRIKESPAFVVLYGDDPKVDAVKSVAEGNVLGRLIKANPVKEVLPGILKDIRNVLGLDKPGAQEVKQEGGKSKPTVTTSALEGEHEDFAGFSDVGDGGDVGTVASWSGQPKHETNTSDENEDESDGIDYAAYSSRIAASSDESDDDDSNQNGTGTRINGYAHRDQISDSMSVSGSEESDAPTEFRPRIEKTKSTPQSLTSTAFLPSLSMGGYYSGSESDIDDGFDHERGPPMKQERKNRRGQRARQQIAEKKFGKEAKHLANQRANGMKTRNEGWDARKGAVGGDDGRRGKPSGRGKFGSRNTAPTGANGDAISGLRTRGPRKDVKKAEGPLHPSWEAAKKRKEESGKVEFAGKKITFD